MTERKPLTGVGYAIPPKTGQFKKGQSGNPKGRRKGSVALSTLIRKSAKERVIVQENGTRKSMTKDDQIENREATKKEKNGCQSKKQDKLRSDGTRLSAL